MRKHMHVRYSFIGQLAAGGTEYRIILESGHKSVQFVVIRASNIQGPSRRLIMLLRRFIQKERQEKIVHVQTLSFARIFRRFYNLAPASKSRQLLLDVMDQDIAHSYSYV